VAPILLAGARVGKGTSYAYYEPGDGVGHREDGQRIDGEGSFSSPRQSLQEGQGCIALRVRAGRVQKRLAQQQVHDVHGAVGRHLTVGVISRVGGGVGGESSRVGSGVAGGLVPQAGRDCGSGERRPSPSAQAFGCGSDAG
jgi:hypothetical protein